MLTWKRLSPDSGSEMLLEFSEKRIKRRAVVSPLTLSKNPSHTFCWSMLGNLLSSLSLELCFLCVEGKNEATF